MTFNIDIFDLFPFNFLSTYSPYLALLLIKSLVFVSSVKQGWHGMAWHVNENFQSTSSSCWYHFKAIFEHVPILPYSHAWAQVGSYLSQTFKIETNFVWYGYVQMRLILLWNRYRLHNETKETDVSVMWFAIKTGANYISWLTIIEISAEHGC